MLTSLPRQTVRLFMVVLVATTTTACLAQSSSNESPGLVIDIDATALIESGLVDQIWTMHDDHDVSEIKELAETYKEVMGINPFKDIQRIRLEASKIDLAAIEDDPARLLAETVLHIRLTKSGNLEGLLLAAPEYSSQDFAGNRIHTCVIPDIGPLHVVFIPDSNKAVDVVGAFNLDAVKQRIQSGKANANFPSDRANDRGAKSIVRIDVSAAETKRIRDRIMSELDEEDEPVVAIARNVIGVLGAITIRLEEVEQEMRIVAQVGVTDKDRVEQLRQLAKGGMALLSILAHEQGDQAALIRTVTESTEIRSEANQVIIVVPLKAAIQVLGHLGSRSRRMNDPIAEAR